MPACLDKYSINNWCQFTNNALQKEARMIYCCVDISHHLQSQRVVSPISSSTEALNHILLTNYYDKITLLRLLIESQIRKLMAEKKSA